MGCTHQHIKKIFIIFFLFTLALITMNSLIERALFDSASKITALDNAEKKVFEREEFFKSSLQRMKADIHALVNSSAFASFLQDDTPSSRKDLIHLLSNLGKFHLDINQLCYLDKDGMEIIRARRTSDDGFAFLPDDKLQDKSKPYYVTEINTRQINEIYFSSLDLNVEDGKVTSPFQPTIRALIPVAIEGKLSGTLIINYSMDGFLKKFVNSPLYDVILADQDGYPIYHYNQEYSWGAYLDQPYSIKQDFPILFDDILSHELLRTDDFVSKKLNLNLHNKLYLILQFKQEMHETEQTENFKRKLILSLIVLLLSGISTYFILKIFKDFFLNYDEINHLNEQLEEHAHTISEHTIYSQTDLDGIITEVSDAFCKLSGYTRKELIGSSHNIVRHPDMPAKTYKELWETLKQGKSWDGEILNRTKEGDPFWSYTMISPHYDEHNTLIGYFSTRVNITSEKEVQMQDRLLKEQEKLAILGQMFENIVHQWRQPLSVITATTNSLRVSSQLGSLTPSQVEESTNGIEKSIHYLIDTITTFKNYIQGSQKLLSYPIQDEIQKVLTIMEPMLKVRGISLSTNLDTAGTLNFTMRSNELAQVLMVLFSNAKDVFEEKQTQEPWIRLELLQQGQKILLSVEDNAGGIPKKVLPRLFTKYFTTKDEHKGTGLGLHMSKEIIEKSFGGKLYVQNTENGAKFIIELNL